MSATSERIRTYEVTIGDHLLPYIVNGDASGLTDAEIREFDNFAESVATEGVPDGYTFGHFSPQESVGFATCEVSGGDGECHLVEIVFFHNHA